MSLENLPIVRSFGWRGRSMFGTVETKSTVTKRRIDEVAVMWRSCVLVRIWPEIFASDAQPLRWNGTLQLKVPNKLNQHPQEANLLNVAQASQGGGGMRGHLHHIVWPSIRRRLDDNGASIFWVGLAANETLALKSDH